jgi:uncharacterized membrane protein YccF (DUF307 family)
MYCTQCGNRQDGGSFCTGCGNQMGEGPSSGTVVQEPSSSLLSTTPSPLTQSVPAYASVGAPAPAYMQPEYAPVAAPSVMTGSTNVSVNVAGPQIIYQPPSGPGFLVRALWFVFIGWYVGYFWIMLAAVLNSTIIGLPIGLRMFNAVPMVMTLKSRNTRLDLVANADGTYTMRHQTAQQLNFWIRAAYFILWGWWFSIVWAMAAYFIGLLIVTLPVSFWMFNRMPAVTTLAQY